MPMDATLDIALLSERAQPSASGSERMRHMFAQHYAGVWRFLRRMGLERDRADDAAQSVFLVALEALPRIADGSERPFLFSTAVRVVFGLRRKRAREVLSEELDAGQSPTPNPEQMADQKRAREILDYLVDRMDLDERTVFVLAEFEEFKVSEIAQLLGVPVGTAASRLRRARGRFREDVDRVFGGNHG